MSHPTADNLRGGTRKNIPRTYQPPTQHGVAVPGPTEQERLSVAQGEPLVARHADRRHQVELGLQQWLKPRGRGICTVEEAVDLATGRPHLETWVSGRRHMQKPF